MEAWDVVILGDGPAALSAAAQASKDGASVLMMSSTALGDGGMGAMNGIACHIQEESNRGHREDTIKMGAFLCDQDIVASRTTKALRIVDLSNAEALTSAETLRVLSWATMRRGIPNHDFAMQVMRPPEKSNKSLRNSV